jgi:DNA topoisomerase-1
VSVKKSQKQKKPAPPFTTSTMQQDAFRKINFSTKRTMTVAQQLYEGLDVAGKGHIGLITYMRTDSTRIAETAKNSARAFIRGAYGESYVGSGFTAAAKKGARVQDAHEAIRPTDVALTPEIASKSLERDQLKLYTLIYNRFLAAMMSNAVYDTAAADIACGVYTLHATGSKLKFAGYLKVYNIEDEEKDMEMPPLAEGEALALKKVDSEQKFTQPPARYTEGTLVKALEEQGIGRPSTYAPTIATILARNYVVLEEKKFKPTDLGEAVNKLMEDNFRDVVNLKFTADMENNLDKIAEGDLEWTDIIRAFYTDLIQEVDQAAGIEKVKLKEEVTDIKCEKCGRNMVVKTGRFGKFLACPGYPDCTFTMPLVEKVNAVCPKCGGEVVVRKTKKARLSTAAKITPTATLCLGTSRPIKSARNAAPYCMNRPAAQRGFTAPRKAAAIKKVRTVVL